MKYFRFVAQKFGTGVLTEEIQGVQRRLIRTTKTKTKEEKDLWKQKKKSLETKGKP